MNAPFDSSQPTIDELIVAAFGLSKSSTPSEINAILKQAASIDLMPLEIHTLLDRIKAQGDIAVGGERDWRGGFIDPGERLAQAIDQILSECFVKDHFQVPP